MTWRTLARRHYARVMEGRSAAGQAAGYHFQIQRALLSLIAGDEGTSVAIETLDDLVVEGDADKPGTDLRRARPTSGRRLRLSRHTDNRHRLRHVELVAPRWRRRVTLDVDELLSSMAPEGARSRPLVEWRAEFAAAVATCRVPAVAALRQGRAVAASRASARSRATGRPARHDDTSVPSPEACDPRQ
jgi:hypothetical protein